MSTFALIHGASDVGWYWHLLEAELRRRGHVTVAPDLPCEDDTAGLAEYADTIVSAIGDREDVVVAAQSFGAFVAPLVATRVPVDAIVFVAGMIPAVGESPGAWWENTRFGEAVAAREDQEGPSSDDTSASFYHDVPRPLVEEATRRHRGQSQTPMGAVWPLTAWPDVPTEAIVCSDDRFFPPSFMRRLAEERLGATPDELAAGHCVALSQPVALADLLERYADRHGSRGRSEFASSR